MTWDAGAATMPHHLDDHRCADLVLGLVTGAERARDLEHAAACTACEERLRSHARALARAAARASEGAGLRVVAGTVGTGGAPRRAWWRDARARGGLAAAALIVALAVPMMMRRPLEAPSRGAALPPAGDVVRTREGGVEDARLGAGLAAYASHDWATADRELTAARATGATEQMRRLYLADVRLQRGDVQVALGLLQSLDWRAIPEPWRRDGAWLLARAWRRAGQDGRADSIEQALKTLDPSTPFVP